MKREDCYKILGLKSNASHEQIKKAYKELARKYHPDKLRTSGNVNSSSLSFTQINDAYNVLISTESLGSVSRDPFDEYITAFKEFDLKTLNKLSEEYPIVFNVDVLLNGYTDDVIDWIIKNNRIDVNEIINLEETLEQDVRYEHSRNGRVYDTEYRTFSRTYNWSTTILGYAIFHDEKFLIQKLIDHPCTDISKVIIPHSAINEEYVGFLEYAAENDNINLLNVALNKQCSSPPSLDILQNAIYLAKKKSSAASLKLLNAYLKSHYRYNIFKLNYNKQWYENVDISWSNTIHVLPANLIQALKELVDFFIWIFNFIFSWEGIFNILFVSVLSLYVAISIWSMFMIVVNVFPGILQDILLNFVMLLQYAIGLGLVLAYVPLKDWYLCFVHNNFDPILDTIRSFLYSIGKKVVNIFNIFYRTQSQQNDKAEQPKNVEPISEPNQVPYENTNHFNEEKTKPEPSEQQEFYSQSKQEDVENLGEKTERSEFNDNQYDEPLPKHKGFSDKSNAASNDNTINPVLFSEQKIDAQKDCLDAKSRLAEEGTQEMGNKQMFSGLKKGFLG